MSIKRKMEEEGFHTPFHAYFLLFIVVSLLLLLFSDKISVTKSILLFCVSFLSFTFAYLLWFNPAGS